MPAGLWRVQDRRTFVELRRSGRRARSGPLGVTWLPAPPGAADSPPRLALATGRAVGNAVVRNRLRRRLRALVTEAASEGRVGPGAYLVAAAPAAAPLSYGELRTHLMSALAAATRA